MIKLKTNLSEKSKMRNFKSIIFLEQQRPECINYLFIVSLNIESTKALKVLSVLSKNERLNLGIYS